MEALEDTQLIKLTKDTFRNSIKTKPQLAERIVTTMAKRLLHANALISKLGGEKRSLEIIYGIR